jgi:hemolysin III
VVKPLLRGWLHLICFFLAIPTGVVLIGLADSVRERVGVAVYVFGMVALFGVSGLYHVVRWSPEWRLRMRRLDHATIFVMIAGTYTPVCLLVLRGWVATTTLVAAWLVAAVGARLAWMSGRRSAVLRSALYIALGWGILAAAPQLVSNLSTTELLLIAAGGVLFTVGSITLATHRPDPVPRVFGHHEIWHVLVVAAVVCHLLAIGSVVGT